MSLLETPQTREYWCCLGEGTLYEEFPVVDAVRGRQSRRPIDGLVVLGGPHVRAESHGGVSLDDQDLVVIQTKATRLNPYVFGQAIFSADLIRLRWRPRSIRPVIVCAEDDPELRPAVDAFADIEVAIIQPERRAWFRLRRVPGATHIAQQLAPGTLTAPARLTHRLRIDGLVSDRPLSATDGVVTGVLGRHIVSVHSYRHTLGMWIAGEVLVAQRILKDAGCASVRSILVVGRSDEAVVRVLSARAEVSVVEHR